MGLTRLAIQRPLAILMLILGLVLMGGVAYTKLRQDRFPAISFPFVSVSIQYPGAAPGDVEDLITREVEDAVAGVAGVNTISSTSREGQSNVNILFVEGTDTAQAALDVERRLAAIRARLPEDASPATVRRADTSAAPVMNVALSSPRRPLSEIYELAEEVVLPRLQAVTGVADVQIVGGLQREIQVQVDASRLRAYGLTLSQVDSALQRENVNVPGGRLSEGGSSQSVRTVGLFRSLEELKQAPLTSGPRIIRLQDVATVTDTYAEQTRLQRLNGQEAVGFIITKQSDSNGVQVSQDLQTALNRAQAGLPRDVVIQVTNDAAKFTRRSLDAVMFDLKLAVVLTAIVLLVFLHTWRPTAIVLLAIPTSLISTFLLMYFFGFSLNTFSLMALALCIGILVDDSIVVLENIERHIDQGEPRREAALRGRSEIGLAAISITLVDVIVFLPVSFMSGNVGRLFKEFGLTIAGATLFSLFISFTLTPMLASRFLKKRDEHSRGPLARFGRWWEAGYSRVADGYRRLLGRSLTGLGRPIVVLVAAATLWGSFQMLQNNVVGSEFAPQEDDGNLSINITTQPGTSLAGTDEVVRAVEQRLKSIPEVQTIFTSVGAGGGFGGSSNTRNASIAVELTDKHHRDRSIFEIIGQVRRWSRDFPGVQMRASINSPLSGGGGPPLNVRLMGEDLDALLELAEKYEAVIRDTPGAVDVNNDSAQRDPEIRALIDRRRLSDVGVSAAEVANTMRTAVGGTVVTQLRPDSSDQIDIRLIASAADRANQSTLGAIPIVAASGAIVRLDQVASLAPDAGPAQIQRSDRQRVISITANVSGRSVGDLARDVRAASARIPLPEGYRVVFGGQVQQQETAFATLLGTLVLSVILVYMLMVALYESLLTPLAILFSIPVAIVGAILGLYVTQNTFNVFSLIGMIMLMGLVGKNAILLVDYTNTLRARGLPRLDAILEAGAVRLRPILMTTSTVIFAMLPLAMKLEAGAETRAPVAVVLIGGVTSSTLLSLLLVPVVYTLLDDARSWVASRLTWRPNAPGWRDRRRRSHAVSGRPAQASPVLAELAETRPIQGGATDD